MKTKILFYKKAILTLLASLSVVTGVVFAVPTAQAADCGGVKTAFNYGCKGTDANNQKVEKNPIYAVLTRIINFLAAGVGLVVAGGIILGAITYINANGNSQKTQQGVSMIVNSFIGLGLFIFMYAILNYLVPGGLIG